MGGGLLFCRTRKFSVPELKLLQFGQPTINYLLLQNWIPPPNHTQTPTCQISFEREELFQRFKCKQPTDQMQRHADELRPKLSKWVAFEAGNYYPSPNLPEKWGFPPICGISDSLFFLIIRDCSWCQKTTQFCSEQWSNEGMANRTIGGEIAQN